MMKSCFALFVVTAALSVPSLFGNAFLVGSSSGGQQQMTTVASRSTVGGGVSLHESAAAATSTTSTTTKEQELPLDSDWFANNDVMSDSIFDKIDTDKDGTISNDELQLHLEGIGYSNMSIRTLFATLDKNADGLISREEMRFAFTNYDIQALYEAFGVGTVGLVSEKAYTNAIDKIRSNANIDPTASPVMLNILADLIFDKIDTDKSGEIDTKELKKHLESVNTGEDDLSAESILTALDLNADGVISREEMRSGFNQFNPKSLSKALGVRASRTSEV